MRHEEEKSSEGGPDLAREKRRAVRVDQYETGRRAVRVDQGEEQ